MIEEFPTRNFIFVRSYLFKTYIKPHVFNISILQFIWQDLVKKGLYKNTEEDIRRCSVKKMFFKISSNSQAEKVKLRRRRLKAAALFKKSHMCFPVHFAKILGTPFLQNASGELLLKMDILQNSCSTEYQADRMIQIFEKHQWRSPILVNLQPTPCNFNEQALMNTQACFNWFSTNVEHLFSRRTPSGCF